MRLAAQEKMGYYPADSKAIAELAKHLQPAGPDVHILDPCAGKGEAIKQIGEEMGLDEDHVYCIELDHGRGAAIRELMPKAKVLAPCSFFSTSMLAGTFGLVYCNPPFDHALGGGSREEANFARDCHRILAPGGILVLVAPFSTFRNRGLALHLDGHYKECAIYVFPDGHRPHHECAFIGVKRNVPISGDAILEDGYLTTVTRIGSYGGVIYNEASLSRLGGNQIRWNNGYIDGSDEELRIWRVPQSRTPGRFAKSGYTDEEMIEAVTSSPINKMAMETCVPPMREPPLPLERGHVAVLLAAGALDGLVEDRDGNHVVRGVSAKIEFYNEEASDYTISEDGETANIKEVYTEQIYLKARAIDRSGTIYTFTAEGSTKVHEDIVHEHEVPYETWERMEKLKVRTVANGCTQDEELSAKRQIHEMLDKLARNKGQRRTGTTS